MKRKERQSPCAHHQDTQGKFEIGSFFAGFSQNTNKLIIAGGILVGLTILAYLPMFLMGDKVLATAAASGSLTPEQIKNMDVKTMLGTLITMALIVPVMMAYWFVPALIKFQDMNPIPAYKKSFSACLKNIIPYLVYGLIITVLIAISLIPLGLGLLVTAPVTMIALYTSYTSIFSG